MLKYLAAAISVLSLSAPIAFAATSDGTVEGSAYLDAKNNGEWQEAHAGDKLAGMGPQHLVLYTGAKGRVSMELKAKPKPLNDFKELTFYFRRSPDKNDKIMVGLAFDAGNGAEMRPALFLDQFTIKDLGYYSAASITVDKIHVKPGLPLTTVKVEYNCSKYADPIGPSLGAVVVKAAGGEVRPVEITTKISDVPLNMAP